MRKRKQYIIDRKFQLRQTFSVIGIIFVIVAIIIGIIGTSAAINNRQLAKISTHNGAIVNNLESVMQLQDDILETLMTWTRNPAIKPSGNVVKEIAQVHYKNLNTIKGDVGTIKSNIGHINRIIRLNTILLVTIVILVLLQGAVLFAVMIRKTHRISGPMYVMSGYMKEIADGKLPRVRPLRKNDEFQDFYALFSRMVDELGKRGAIK
jgi:nitrate/nitrite-specific signal transduction histidine kinase